MQSYVTLTGRLKSGAVTGVGDQNFENKSLSVACVFTIPGGGSRHSAGGSRTRCMS